MMAAMSHDGHPTINHALPPLVAVRRPELFFLAVYFGVSNFLMNILPPVGLPWHRLAPEIFRATGSSLEPFQT